jgi:hypothetical protein
MNEETKPNQPEDITDEQLEDVAGGMGNTVQNANCTSILSSVVL